MKKHTEAFEIFWKAYPQKKGKSEAEKWWLKHKPDLSEVLAALELQIKEKEWLKTQKQFVSSWPHGSTWVHQKRWTDGFDIEFEKHIRIEQEKKKAGELTKKRYRRLYTETIKNANKADMEEAMNSGVLMINQGGQRAAITNIRWLIQELRPDCADHMPEKVKKQYN